MIQNLPHRMTYAILFGRFSVLDFPSKFPFRFLFEMENRTCVLLCVCLNKLGWLILLSFCVCVYKIKRIKCLLTFFGIWIKTIWLPVIVKVYDYFWIYTTLAIFMTNPMNLYDVVSSNLHVSHCERSSWVITCNHAEYLTTQYLCPSVIFKYWARMEWNLHVSTGSFILTRVSIQIERKRNLNNIFFDLKMSEVFHSPEIETNKNKNQNL